MEKYKEYEHNPPHLFIPHSKYFITGATYKKKYFLISDKAKDRVFHSLYKGFNSSGWTLEEWVILHNHYHVMVNAPENAESLSAIIRDIHKFTAMWIKKNVPENLKTMIKFGGIIGIRALRTKNHTLPDLTIFGIIR